MVSAMPSSKRATLKRATTSEETKVCVFGVITALSIMFLVCWLIVRLSLSFSLVVFGESLEANTSQQNTYNDSNNVNSTSDGRNAINHTPLNILSITPVSSLENNSQASVSNGQLSNGAGTTSTATTDNSIPQASTGVTYQAETSALPDELPPEWFFDALGITSSEWENNGAYDDYNNNNDTDNNNIQPNVTQSEPRHLPDLPTTNGQVILPRTEQTPSPLTPDGGGELVDTIMVGDMEFITINSQAGNTFFLIIDRARDADNVYFLAPVTEFYLMSLAWEAGDEASIQQGGMLGFGGIQAGHGAGIANSQQIQVVTGQEVIYHDTGSGRVGMSAVSLLVMLGAMSIGFFFMIKSRQKKRNAGVGGFVDGEDGFGDEFDGDFGDEFESDGEGGHYEGDGDADGHYNSNQETNNQEDHTHSDRNDPESADDLFDDEHGSHDDDNENEHDYHSEDADVDMDADDGN